MTGEMRTLLEQAASGDRDAEARLIEDNSGLIWSIVRRYYGRGTEPDDLYQLACVGRARFRCVARQRVFYLCGAQNRG